MSECPDSRRIFDAVIDDRAEGLVADLRRFAAEVLPDEQLFLLAD